MIFCCLPVLFVTRDRFSWLPCSLNNIQKKTPPTQQKPKTGSPGWQVDRECKKPSSQRLLQLTLYLLNWMRLEEGKWWWGKSGGMDRDPFYSVPEGGRRCRGWVWWFRINSRTVKAFYWCYWCWVVQFSQDSGKLMAFVEVISASDCSGHHVVCSRHTAVILLSICFSFLNIYADAKRQHLFWSSTPLLFTSNWESSWSYAWPNLRVPVISWFSECLQMTLLHFAL